MDEKIKNDDKQVLLAEEKETGKLKAVSGIDEKGNIETIEPTKKNQSKFLDINKNGNLLENFFKNFMQQARNPSHTGFYAVSMNMIEKGLDHIQSLIENGTVEKYSAYIFQSETENQGQQPTHQSTGQPEEKQEFQPFDENKIDRDQLKRLGVKWEDIEPNLKAMLYGHKSPHLIEMKPVFEGQEIPTKGRLSLEETSDGTLRFIPHFYQEKPDLSAPFHGIMLTEQDKENLLKTGNAGRVIELEPASGEKVQAFVSLDKLTNSLEALSLDKVNIPEKIKGVELSPEQQKALGEGRKVLVEGMTSRNNGKFDGYIQINASRKAFDFSYEGLDRNHYREKLEQKQDGEQQRERKVRIPDKLLGVELTTEQKQQLANNKTIYVKGMIKEGQDQPFNAYIKVNREEKKLQFFKWNPDKAKEIKSKPEENKQENKQEKKTVKKTGGLKM